VKHNERNDQLLVMRMMLVAKQERREMKRECCDEVEQRLGYAVMKVWCL